MAPNMASRHSTPVRIREDFDSLAACCLLPCIYDDIIDMCMYCVVFSKYCFNHHRLDC